MGPFISVYCFKSVIVYWFDMQEYQTFFTMKFPHSTTPSADNVNVSTSESMPAQGIKYYIKSTLAVRVCNCLRQQSCILTSLVQVKNGGVVV